MTPNEINSTGDGGIEDKSREAVHAYYERRRRLCADYAEWSAPPKPIRITSDAGNERYHAATEIAALIRGIVVAQQ
jgi:hypothetical protein